MKSHDSRPGGYIETLESRFFLAATPADISQLAGPAVAGNRTACCVAVDTTTATPTAFAISIVEGTDELLGANCSGVTWGSATPIEVNGQTVAGEQADAIFDRFGNLFVALVNPAHNDLEVLLSTDQGVSFSVEGSFRGAVATPKLAAGSGYVWLTFRKGKGIAATDAVDSGTAPSGFAPASEDLPGSGGGVLPSIAVNSSASGEQTVLVAFQRGAGIYVAQNSTGAAPGGFGRPMLVTTTSITAPRDLPADPTGVMADPSIAFAGGIAYLVYVDAPSHVGADTDIELCYDPGPAYGTGNWSRPIRVNSDTTLNSQFLPTISSDVTGNSGEIAIGWYDASNDLGTGGPADPDEVPDDQVYFFATIVAPSSTTGIVDVYPGQQVSTGATFIAAAHDPAGAGGDGVALATTASASYLYLDWSDNSSNLNVAGSEDALNGYGAALSASGANPISATASPFQWVGDFSHATTASAEFPSGAPSVLHPVSGILIANVHGGGKLTIDVFVPGTASIDNLSIVNPTTNGRLNYNKLSSLRVRGGWIERFTLAPSAGGKWTSFDSGSYIVEASLTGNLISPVVLGVIVIDIAAIPTL